MLMLKTIIIIILLILILLFNYSEPFTIFNPVDENTPNGFYNIDRFLRILFPSNKHTSSIYENRFNFIPTTINDDKLNNDISLSTSNYDDLKSNNCCLVKKELNNNNFKYTYKKYNDLKCDIDNFVLDQNNQLLFDGINNWNNNECKDDTTKLGSCQHYNFECIDFIDKETCDKYNEKMPPDPLNRKFAFTWSNKPCYNK
jgi:hypothetical protein